MIFSLLRLIFSQDSIELFQDVYYLSRLTFGNLSLSVVPVINLVLVWDLYSQIRVVVLFQL